MPKTTILQNDCRQKGSPSCPGLTKLVTSSYTVAVFRLLMAARCSWPDLATGTLTSPLQAPGAGISSSARLFNVSFGAIGGNH